MKCCGFCVFIISWFLFPSLILVAWSLWVQENLTLLPVPAVFVCASSLTYLVFDSAVLEVGIRVHLPSRQMWEYLLTHFLGASALLTAISSRCAVVFLYPLMIFQSMLFCFQSSLFYCCTTDLCVSSIISMSCYILYIKYMGKTFQNRLAQQWIMAIHKMKWVCFEEF